MNSTFVFVLSIIAIVMATGVAQTYIKHGRKRPELDEDEDAGAAEMLATIERLEERIQVLERIVTEKNVDLKQKIEDL